MNPLMVLRVEARLSRSQLADKAGVSWRTIFRIEMEGQRPTDETLFKLADALEVEPLALRDQIEDFNLKVEAA